MTSLEACPQRAATPFDTFPPLGCSYLTCKVFSSLPGSHAIISAAKPASFLSKGLPRNMKSWETLVAARWHTRRPGVACPAGSDPWLVPPCIAPFSRSLGRCVSATSPFLSATGASGDHPMIKQRSQRARAVIFVDRVPRAGKRSKGFGSLPLPPPLLYTPPTPVHANEGQPLGKRASLAAQTIETKPSGGDLALFPKRVGCVVRTGICGPEEHHGLELSLWMGGMLGLR